MKNLRLNRGQPIIILLISLCFLLSTDLKAENMNNEYPENWGILSSLRFGNSECPDVNGTFFDDGVGYAVRKGVPSNASMNGSLRTKINTLFIFDKKPNFTSVKEAQNEINISQKKSLEISLFPKLKTNILETYMFSEDKNDFKCKSGWLIFDEIKSSIGAESSHINYIEQISVSRLDDGSLIVFTQEYAKETSIWYFGMGKYESTLKMYAKFKQKINL